MPANIIAIASDERVRSQVEKLVKEFNSDDIKIQIFKNAKEFDGVYFPVIRPTPVPDPKSAASPAPKPTPAPAPTAATTTATEAPAEAAAPAPEAKPDEAIKEKKDETDADSAPFKNINVIIVAYDSIGEKLQPWASQILKKTKQKGLWPENNRTRLVLLKYEDDGVNKLDVLLPELDDLIYIPLDRLVFLQKLEVLMNLPKKIKGTFLFNQELQAEIEISKIARVEKISDVGIAVRNPLPLQTGTRAKFYMTLPGEKETIRFFAKSIRSEPHPEYPDQYLCYFSYFGLRGKETSRIRQWLGKTNQYKALLNQDSKAFKLDPNDLFAVETAGQKRNLVVIDPGDPGATIKQIQNEMDHVQMFAESSYHDFIYKYLTGRATTAPPRSSLPTDFPGGAGFQLQVQMNPKNVKRLSITPTEEDLFLGYKAADLLRVGAEDWWRPFKSEQNENVFTEAVELIKDKKSVKKIMSVTSATNETVAIKVEMTPDTEDSIAIAVDPMPADEYALYAAEGPKIQNIDALVIDTAFIPKDFMAWIEFLKNSMLQKNFIKRPEDLKILLISEREDRLEREWLDSPHVVGFIIKPLETRTMNFLLSEALKAQMTIYRFENIGWAKTATNAHMSREIQLEALSEFGATLRSSSPFRPGSVFFLRKLIYDNAPNQCLSARVYFCEEHPSEKDQFQISITYYGINDGFLKFARTWIRDTYAASKSKEGS